MSEGACLTRRMGPGSIRSRGLIVPVLRDEPHAAGAVDEGRFVILAVDGREFVPGRMTGIGRFLRGLLEEIARSRPHLHTVILAKPGTPVPLTATNIRVHPLPDRPTLYWDQMLLPRALRQVGAAAFFSPYYKAPLFAPCPTVVTIHDLIPLTFPAYSRGAWSVFAAGFRRWVRLLADRAAAVITDSAHTQAALERELGLPRDRLHVIPIGIAEEFRPDPPPEAVAAATRRYGIDGPYLLAVGNFLPHKNLPRLVEAFQELPEGLRLRMCLVLAGEPGGHAPAQAVDRVSLNRPGVLLPGFIPPEDLPLLYAGATAYVCASLDEGFGLPVVEAMACGIPVVCARAGALPEVAGDAALYVDPSDVTSLAAGLKQILEDEPLRRELACRGVVRARLYEARKTTARLVDLLEGIVAGRGRG